MSHDQLNPQPDLTVILPCYKTEGFIEASVKAKLDALEKTNIDFELICVVDGIVDRTSEILEAIHHDRLKVVTYSQNRGKGYTIRKGWEVASGKFVGYIDSDFDIDFSIIPLMFQHARSTGADIVYPNKYNSKSTFVSTPLRKVMSFGYRALIKIFFRIDVKDTQTGAKLYRSEVVKQVGPLCRIDGLGFEIETFFVASQLGLDRFEEVPVIIHKDENTVISQKMIWKIFTDTISLFLNLRQRKDEISKARSS